MKILLPLLIVGVAMAQPVGDAATKANAENAAKAVGFRNTLTSNTSTTTALACSKCIDLGWTSVLGRDECSRGHSLWGPPPTVFTRAEIEEVISALTKAAIVLARNDQHDEMVVEAATGTTSMAERYRIWNRLRKNRETQVGQIYDLIDKLRAKLAAMEEKR